jgi:hypothetical protein
MTVGAATFFDGVDALANRLGRGDRRSDVHRENQANGSEEIAR